MFIFTRVMREIEAVKQEAALLQEQMGVVKQDIQKVKVNHKLMSVFIYSLKLTPHKFIRFIGNFMFA